MVPASLCGMRGITLPISHASQWSADFPKSYFQTSFPVSGSEPDDGFLPGGDK